MVNNIVNTLILMMKQFMNKEQIENYFIFSNWIEGVEDKIEVQKQIQLFSNCKNNELTSTRIRTMHNSIGHLNAYCKPGVFRNYHIVVDKHQSMVKDRVVIGRILQALYSRDSYKTEDSIIRSHIFFEQLHPFGDGNGRIGRLIMLIQLYQQGLEIPSLFLPKLKDFEMNRKKYYQLFKN